MSNARPAAGSIAVELGALLCMIGTANGTVEARGESGCGSGASAACSAGARRSNRGRDPEAALAPYGTDYLSGLTDGIAWGHGKKLGDPLFCPPGRVSIMPDQYRKILRRKVESDPALTNAHAGYVMLLAMVDAFPCPVKP